MRVGNIYTAGRDALFQETHQSSRSQGTAKTQQSAQTNLHLNVTRFVAVVAFSTHTQTQTLHKYNVSRRCKQFMPSSSSSSSTCGTAAAYCIERNNGKIRMKRNFGQRRGVGLQNFSKFSIFYLLGSRVSSFSLSAGVDVLLLLLLLCQMYPTTNGVYLCLADVCVFIVVECLSVCDVLQHKFECLFASS